MGKVSLKCPACGNTSDDVTMSRTTADGNVTRRRRQCRRCGHRYSTVELVVVRGMIPRAYVPERIRYEEESRG